jgi:hypothetical protein
MRVKKKDVQHENNKEALQMMLLFKKDKEEKKGSYVNRRSYNHCISQTHLKENIQLYCGIYFKF